MPSHHLIRRDSWPPTILRLGPEGALDISDTDANPFAYFLEPAIPPSSDNDDDYLDLSAGIERDDTKTPQVREVSPSSLQRLPILSDEELEAEQAERDMHDWLSVPRRRERGGGSGRSAKASKGGTVGAARGRGLVRNGAVLGPGPVTRSRSAGARGRAWREPSPEIGVIVEEGEDVEMEIGGAPGPGGEGEKVEGGGWGKLKKRVHWATPVEK
ncbi:hypothetical protein VE03_07796 [Pseudogymnoascus sp. 23342-1-I1]|nr:hypothetical protein VE03_07796 [Pseudogymnoascus sp. 23342-1-I1]